MAKFSMNKGGKEVGPAEVYAEPHNMRGEAGVDIKDSGYQGGSRLTANEINMSVGNISRDSYPDIKTDGIKIRGTGAATKGTMARGPMA